MVGAGYWETERCEIVHVLARGRDSSQQRRNMEPSAEHWSF